MGRTADTGISERIEKARLIMKKFKRKLRLFKNDPFGIKEKYFKFRVEKAIKDGTKIRTKALRVYLNIVNDICIPRDDEEKEILRKVVKRYDETIAELEKSMKYARLYIGEESEVNNEQNI